MSCKLIAAIFVFYFAYISLTEAAGGYPQSNCLYNNILRALVIASHGQSVGEADRFRSP